MITQFDEKGKIFTNVVSKKPVTVLIQTSQYRIQGQIHVRQDSRLKDELNDPEIFLAVTDAAVYDNNGNELYSSNFITVNRAQIIFIIPAEEIKKNEAGQE
jgi:hypothetical protein